MADDGKQNVASGSFATQQTHEVETGILQAAIADYEAMATTFAVHAISDDKVRQQYVKHIRAISESVREAVDEGNMNVKQGAEFCSGLRDQLFVEYRKYTSAVGVAAAEKKKLTARGFDYYLNKYAEEIYGKQFAELTQDERPKVYYKTLIKAGMGNANVTSDVKRLRLQSSALLMVTAILAVAEIVKAKDHVRAAARQGSIIAGGMIGGTAAGLSASFLCGPAEPLCALLVVLIGANAGGIAAEQLDDAYQDVLPIFTDWINN